MTIDFQKEDSRKNYLYGKLDDLQASIDTTYGQALLDELVSRLEFTIRDFDSEVQELMQQLKENLQLKEKMMTDLRSGQVVHGREASAPEPEEKTSASAWEKRLENLGKK